MSYTTRAPADLHAYAGWIQYAASRNPGKLGVCCKANAEYSSAVPLQSVDVLGHPLGAQTHSATWGPEPVGTRTLSPIGGEQPPGSR